MRQSLPRTGYGATGNGASSVEHADDDGSGVVPLQRRVNRQGQAIATPPGQHPFQQWSKTEAHVQFRPAGTGPVAAVVEPFSQVLPSPVPVAPGREGCGHGVLAGAARQDGPANPQRQAGQLWLGEVRQMRFNGLLHLIAFSGKAHWGSPAFGRVTTKMPDANAPSQAKPTPDFDPLHTLVRYPVRGRLWAGWRHHITMCLLAGAFLLGLQQDWEEKDAPDHSTPRCTEWCVNCCPKHGSDRRNCWGGWQMSRSATNGPDVPTRNAALPSVATLPAYLPNPSL